MKVLNVLFFVLLAGFIVSGCDWFEKVTDAKGELPYEIKLHSLIPDSDFSSTGKCRIYVTYLQESGVGLLKELDGSPVSDYIQLRVLVGDDREEATMEGEPTVRTPSGNTWVFAMDIDSSGSNSSTDPDRMRVDAAKLFIRTIFDKKSDTHIGVFDFGAGSTGSFSVTRELFAFANDSSGAQSACDGVKESGGTPLYTSVDELLDYVNTQRSSGDYERAVLVLTDGYAYVPSTVQAIYDKSVQYAIPVNVVAFDKGANANMSDLAANTSGIASFVESAEDLETAFENIALGSEEGYAVYSLTMPEGTQAGDSCQLVLSDPSGSLESTLDTTIPGFSTSDY